MTAARIFAAVDASGAVRFVGDVPGGSACGCFCAVCGSPLVARKGDVNVWHFAHEAQQERVECLVGAMNLLRRVAADYLRSLPRLMLPKYRRDVSRLLQTRRATETVEWDAQPVAVEWLEAGAQDAPIARLQLDTDAFADLSVEISDSPPVLRYPPAHNHIGSIVFWSTVPVDSDLRKELYARQHVQRWGRMVWLHQPDSYGLIADAQARLDAAARAEERQLAEQARRDRERLERWHAEHSQRPPAAPARTEQLHLPPWARHKKANRPFFGFRFSGYGAWVLFEMEDGRAAIRQLDGNDRWFDQVKSPEAVFDSGLDLLVVPSFTIGQSILRGPLEATRISSDFADILQLR
jgi:hypothetical protein